jgi:hypothetical protein
MEGSCSTGQSPQWAVVPVEEEEEMIICKRYKCTVELLHIVSINHEAAADLQTTASQ